MTAPTAVTGPGGGGSTGDKLSGKPVLVPMCIPCGQNEYVENNECHGCGPKAVVSLAARTCIPCQQGQVAKLMAGALTCAADCSKVGGGGNVRPSTHYITDPKNKTQCMACSAGSRANATHTECLKKSAPVAALDEGRKAKPKDLTPKKNLPEGRVVKINCPPGLHPNSRGTGCLPDLDTSEFGTGSRPGPGGGSRAGGGVTPGGSFGISVPGRR